MRPRFSTLLIGLVVPVAAARASEDENWKRLRSMPREQRVLLAGKIRDFDRLGSAEKAAVRALDEELRARSPAEQADLKGVLRRYHLWVQTLPEERRKQLEAAAPEQRMALVSKFRAEEGRPSARRSIPVFLQVVGPSPFEVARRLKLWFELTPEERVAVEKKDLVERTKLLAELVHQKRLKPIARLSKAQEEELVGKIENDPRLQQWAAWPLKKAETKKSLQVRASLADNYHFLINPPEKVESANLLRFESAMPHGFRALFDQFPPEEAKRRLTILYRLIYPSPAEFAPPQGTPGKSSPPRRAAPGRPQGAPPRPPAAAPL